MTFVLMLNIFQENVIGMQSNTFIMLNKINMKISNVVI